MTLKMKYNVQYDLYKDIKGVIWDFTGNIEDFEMRIKAIDKEVKKLFKTYGKANGGLIAEDIKTGRTLPNPAHWP